MTEFTTVEPSRPEAKIPRDRWQRYLIPHPETGKVQSWTRATTLASTLADRFGLEKWAKRNVALGLAARHDLYAQVATCKPDETDKLNRLVADAEEAAASSAGANLGTALHRFTEQYDRGEDPTVPPPWDKDVAAYKQAMDVHGLEVYPAWIETVLVVPELDVAGTCDRLINRPGEWTQPRIADLKTGKDVLRYGMTEIALQLAIYAHATHWYNPQTNTCYEIVDKIDQYRAVVIHLPVGRGECVLYDVDIQAGWEAVQLAVDVRNWRKRKDLAQQMVPQQIAPEPTAAIPEPIKRLFQEQDRRKIADDTLEPDAIDWLYQRVEAIKTAGHGPLLATEWSRQPDIPTFPKGGPTTQQEFDAIDAMCDRVEAMTDMPFGPTNPTTPPATTIKKRA